MKIVSYITNTVTTDIYVIPTEVITKVANRLRENFCTDYVIENVVRIAAEEPRMMYVFASCDSYRDYAEVLTTYEEIMAYENEPYFESVVSKLLYKGRPTSDTLLFILDELEYMDVVYYHSGTLKMIADIMNTTIRDIVLNYNVTRAMLRTVEKHTREWKQFAKDACKFTNPANMLIAFNVYIEVQYMFKTALENNDMKLLRELTAATKIGQKPKYIVRWLDAYYDHKAEPEDVIEWELNTRNRMVAAEWFASWKQILRQSYVKSVIGLLYTEDDMADYFYADVYSYENGEVLMANEVEFHISHTECFIKRTSTPKIAIVKLDEVDPNHEEFSRVDKYIKLLLKKGVRIIGITNGTFIEIRDGNTIKLLIGGDDD